MKLRTVLLSACSVGVIIAVCGLVTGNSHSLPVWMLAVCIWTSALVVSALSTD